MYLREAEALKKRQNHYQSISHRDQIDAYYLIDLEGHHTIEEVTTKLPITQVHI